VFVAHVRLVNFRSYRDARFEFSPGLNIVVGQNASGKTNLLEGAFYALRAASPRTSRDDKLIAWGQEYTRAEAQLGDGRRVQVFYGAGQGKRVRVNDVDAASLDEVRRRVSVFIFVPESLLLVKGSPARRRAHLDAVGVALDPAYAAAAADLQLALRQRNALLLSVRAGASASSLDQWDAQLARAGTDLGRRRRDLVERLSGPFAAYAAGLAPQGGDFAVRLRSPLEAFGYEQEAFRAALLQRRGREVQRGLSLLGPHRDELEILEVGGATPTGAEGRDLRLYGSQGEQRAAVLALLLAERDVAAAVTGDVGTLFLDDVMSELDDRRRRLLVATLLRGGQAIATTTTTMYFEPHELEQAHVIQLAGAAAESQLGGAGPEEELDDAVAEDKPGGAGPEA
jgi:DNA replication and repair protein RecF